MPALCTFDSQRSDRQSRLTAVFVDAGIATPAALDAVLAAVYRPLPDCLAHVNRVARLSAHIGRELNLSARSVEDVERAALVHDLGRLVVPGGEQELGGIGLYQPIEQVFACAAIVSAVPFLGRAADIVLASRECLDGSGVPFGLTESSISLEARILHVADTFDTFSVLCSKLVVPVDTVGVELARHAGTKFDSEVVAACLRCIRSVGPAPPFHCIERRVC
jgi:HD-GYP domain-containing protein (c-di-GMP phosphodiesterase class II)